jgi:Ca2+-binding RTX toxin-like protein
LLIVAVAPLAKAATIQCPTGTSELNPCEGTDSNDAMYGNTGWNDYMYAYFGNDILWGYSYYDTLHAGDGHDTLHGGSDGDYLWGGKGDDGLKGGDGADNLRDREGQDIWNPIEADVACGAGGNDYIDIKDGDTHDYYAGGSGTNTVVKDSGDQQVTPTECDQMSG